MEPEDPPFTNFYGAVKGKSVYITFNDSVATGKVKNKGRKIEFVAQNQQYDPPHSPATAIGVMTRQ